MRGASRPGPIPPAWVAAPLLSGTATAPRAAPESRPARPRRGRPARASAPTPSRRLLALADDEHVRHLGELGVADLAPDRLGALVDSHPDAALAELGGDRARVVEWRSETGRTGACTGASQGGKRPP